MMGRWLRYVYLVVVAGILALTVSTGRAEEATTRGALADTQVWHHGPAELDLEVRVGGLPDPVRAEIERMLTQSGYTRGAGSPGPGDAAVLDDAARRSIRRDAAALLAGGGRFPEGYVPDGAGPSAVHAGLDRHVAGALKTALEAELDAVLQGLERALDTALGSRQRPAPPARRDNQQPKHELAPGR